MKNAIVIDPLTEGEFHAVINASILLMAAGAYDTVVYRAHPSACATAERLLSDAEAVPTNIRFEKRDYRTKFGNRHGGLVLHYLYCSLCLVPKILRTPKEETILLNHNVPTALPLLNLLSCFKKNDIVVFCHSELELVLREDSKGLSVSEKLLRRVMRRFFLRTRISPRLKFVLLGDRMKECFQAGIAQKNRDRIFSVDHAYFKQEGVMEPPVRLPDSDALRIGIPGLVNGRRGLPEVRAILRNLGAGSGLRLHAIGRVDAPGEDLESLGLTLLNKSDKLLQANVYDGYVRQMDFLLIVYPLGSYRLTASGATLEAIWWEKPVVALRNEYIDYLFRKYGEMGILCDSLEDLVETIRNLRSLPREKLQTFRENLAKAREALKPWNVRREAVGSGIFRSEVA